MIPTTTRGRSSHLLPRTTITSAPSPPGLPAQTSSSRTSPACPHRSTHACANTCVRRPLRCDVHNNPQLLASSDHHPANPFKSWRNHRTLPFLLRGSSLACTRPSISPTARPSSSRACPCTFAPSKHPFALFKSRVGTTVAPASTLTDAISLSRATSTSRNATEKRRAHKSSQSPTYQPYTSIGSTLGPEAIADFSIEVFADLRGLVNMYRTHPLWFLCCARRCQLQRSRGMDLEASVTGRCCCNAQGHTPPIPWLQCLPQ
ncbi:hypothetical protein L227DRAFT_354323 [Lentinus tigrinus ALCF2SS1-6]|uniref:Uncharacterized protein n=1 Tax=Lentinus tigrinus ALCF2SS1-6 TaxID=1328759 RepID=A0A5C2RRB0_9APHY|nr:hypothetical protein L227DRAFT_354323 [Lentinus tigrinus ALCF2SS1-6]